MFIKQNYAYDIHYSHFIFYQIPKLKNFDQSKCIQIIIHIPKTRKKSD